MPKKNTPIIIIKKISLYLILKGNYWENPDVEY